jgi:hypothetical protein
MTLLIEVLSDPAKYARSIVTIVVKDIPSN